MSHQPITLTLAEMQSVAMFNAHKAMSFEVAHSRLQVDMDVLIKQLNAAKAQAETLTKERDAALAERDAARAELAAPKAPMLLPSGGVDEEPAQKPAGPQDEVALTGSMGG